MPSFITNWNDRYGHLRWYHKYEFLIPFIIILSILGIIYLPEFGRPETINSWIRVIGFFVLFFGWGVLILSHREKPVLFKRVVSLITIILFFYFFYKYSGAKWDRLQTKFFNIKMLDGIWIMYLNGFLLSLKLMLVSMVLALLIGTLFGLLRSFKNPVLEICLVAYIDFFRAFPLIALMMVVFYALPFFGLNFTPFMAATISIVLMYSAYIAEIVRSGIEAIHKTQLEASYSLGLSKTKTLRYVILPQAVRIMIPPLTSSCVSILKDTAVAYVVTLPELLTQAQQAVIWKSNPTPIIFSSIIYLVVLFPLTRFAHRLETRSKRWIKTS